MYTNLINWLIFLKEVLLCYLYLIKYIYQVSTEKNLQPVLELYL